MDVPGRVLHLFSASFTQAPPPWHGEPMLRDVVIVGASLAGLRAAEQLRSSGFDGSVVLVGAEEHLPYDRPPLSKRFLAGEMARERVFLRDPGQYADLSLELRLGRRATRLDVAARRVHLDDGAVLPFGGLVIATGASPRRLPGQPDAENLFELRTIDDSARLREALLAGPERVVVIGAGFIGAEVAATARTMGLEVTLLEALEVPLGRVLGERLGSVYADVHRDHGVDLRLGAAVAGFEVSGERVRAVVLADGTRVAADVVVVGVGVAPNTDWLAGSGLELRDGVVCDTSLCAGPPGVYAAGDVARWPHALFGEEMRIEHWTNAAEQGARAAANLLAVSTGAEPVPYADVPFFWSDQYDRRLQFLGRASAADDMAVVHGSLEERCFVVLFGSGGRLRGALGMNAPRVLMPYRKMIAAGTLWESAVTPVG